MTIDKVTAEFIGGAPGDEGVALEWAINFFRKRAAVMTREGSANATVDFMVRTFLSGWDNEANTDGGIKIIEYLTNSDAPHVLPRFVAALIERGDELPTPFVSFITSFLRDPGKWQPPKSRGPDRRTLFIRDLNIGAAVGAIAEGWGFSPTRNGAAKRSCGASIVQRALIESIKLHVSEADIVRCWKRFSKGLKKMKESGEAETLVLNDVVVVTVPRSIN